MSYQIISPDDFARRFSMRSTKLMWLLGAGASASAGIPTAWDMIWEFKQQLYVSQRQAHPKSVADLYNPAVRGKLQGFIDSTGKYPQLGEPDEYAALFETTYPNESDRQSYINAKLKGAKPSYGHIALASLLKSDLAHIIWTTNFDTLVADACAKVYDSTAHLSSVALDAPELAKDVFNNLRWPTEIKLHGDFRSRRLKNTTDELMHQDAILRKVFVDACKNSGLIVVGYSGRDDSIMEAIEEAMDSDGAFPHGLFWLNRGESAPLARVQKTLAKAAENGIDGGIVSIENFDEALRDLIKVLPNIDTTFLDSFASERPVWSSAPFPKGKGAFPVVRLNALKLSEFPTISRRVNCKIGGYSEVRSAIESADLPVIATRISSGVLAFGEDDNIKTAFSPYQIEEFDLYTIHPKKLRHDSQERGLLRHALYLALSQKHNLTPIRKSSDISLYPTNANDGRWGDLKKALGGNLSGSVRGHPELSWFEGISIKLAWASDHLWLLFEPRIIMLGTSFENRAAATDFSRERTVRRYNKQLNEVIDFWAKLLATDANKISTFNTINGVDAIFRFEKVTAFSRRWVG